MIRQMRYWQHEGMPNLKWLNPSLASSRPTALEPMEEARKRLIVALDVPHARAATEPR